MLKKTHPSLYQKLECDDTAPDPITKHRKKAHVPPKASSAPKDSESAEKIKEAVEPPFTDTGYFDDSCDVPLGAVIEHVISEGKDAVAGVVEQEDGTLARLAQAEDPDAEVPEVVEGDEKKEELRRGKRVRTLTSRLQSKDWEWTHDMDVSNDDEGKKKRRKKLSKR